MRTRVATLLALLIGPFALAQDARSVSVDPPPLTERRQWVIDLRWDRGAVYLVQVRLLEAQNPVTTPRVIGRFAIELTEKGTLVERARFDFPGLAVPEQDGGVNMTAHLRTRIGVLFPATSRGDRLELVDRATGQRWTLPWPPRTPEEGRDGG